MSSSPFIVTEHTVDTQYIREYPRATTTQDAPLKLIVKKYTPVDNLDPQPGDVTLVGFHGAGIPKELYEPLWEEILARCKRDKIGVRAIWFADAANKGASGIYNEKYLGNDPGWMDHSRDMLLMINHFRKEMPQPIMGVGHSLGTTQLIFLSMLHPRLFTGLIIIEPFFAPNMDKNDSPLLVLMALSKKDVWPSRQVAAEKARKVFPHWDPRVFSRWVQYGYRDLPTLLYPETENGTSGTPVTLSTTKHQEVLMYTRPNLDRHQELGLPQTGEGDERPPPHDPLFFPDVMGKLPKGYQFYRYESILAWRMLPHLRPSVLYIGGSNGTMEKSGTLLRGAKRTGTRWGGSGGMEYDRVKHITVENAGHDVPLQKITETADAMALWIAQEVERWRGNERRIAAGWDGLSAREKAVFPDEWKDALKATPMGPWAKKILSKL
ncbi:toxin biosynthesis protein [Penicillium frequentans]|uniref:Toxin biosynthesis protein n=1 Tax=Penicillium frequentans TaxID=3151616 RepID=A0AAD6CQG7_9EURO|nr:toxin biosynthesis protein [Penicillium glabrum]